MLDSVLLTVLSLEAEAVTIATQHHSVSWFYILFYILHSILTTLIPFVLSSSISLVHYSRPNHIPSFITFCV